jgi:hypothetical protein
MRNLILGCALVAALASPAVAGEVELDGLVSAAPNDWQEQPAGGMRAKHFILPAGAAGEKPTELIIFFFGKGAGGNAEGNITRWKGMFEKPEAKVTEETIAGAKTTLVEITGTYLYKARPMEPGPGERREGQRMIGVVFETPNGPYFMRLVGPDATVTKHKPAFLAWLRGFKKK